MYGSLLNMGQGMLHSAAEAVHAEPFLAALAASIAASAASMMPVPFQGGYLHNLAAQLPGQLCNIDLISVFLDHIHHIDRDHNRNSQLGQLGGQIQVSLQVGSVDDIQNGIRPLTDQVISAPPLPPAYKETENRYPAGP